MSFIVADTGQTVSAKFDGALRNSFVAGSDYIIKDIGQEFAMTYQSGSLALSVASGIAIIGGRGISAEESNSITLPSNSTVYLMLRIDLTQTEGNRGLLYASTTEEERKDNLNDSTSAIRDIILAKITTSADSITDIEDRRVISENSTTLLRPLIRVTTPEEVEITCTNGSATYTKTGTNVEFGVQSYGDWTVSAIIEGQTVSQVIHVDAVKIYDTELAGSSVMGIKRAINGSSPIWERTDDAVDLNVVASIGATAGYSDFDDMPIYKDIQRITKPTGDVMVRFPKFYYQRYRADGNEYIKICNRQREGFKLHPAFRKGDQEIDYFEVGAYKTTANHLSKSGLTPLVNLTRAQFRTNARAKGVGWGIIDATTNAAIQMLYLVEFANNNCQLTIGGGNTGTSAKINTGDTDAMFALGNHTGRPEGSDNAKNTIYRGVEGLWGNIDEWCDGLNFNNGTYYICEDPSHYADDVATNYDQLPFTLPTNLSRSFITQMGYDEEHDYLFLPTVASGGNESTYWCDGAWSNTGWRVFVRSGYYDGGGCAGLFLAAVSTGSSGASASIGSRLLYCPLS